MGKLLSVFQTKVPFSRILFNLPLTVRVGNSNSSARNRSKIKMPSHFYVNPPALLKLWVILCEIKQLFLTMWLYTQLLLHSGFIRSRVVVKPNCDANGGQQKSEMLGLQLLTNGVGDCSKVQVSRGNHGQRTDVSSKTVCTLYIANCRTIGWGVGLSPPFLVSRQSGLSLYVGRDLYLISPLFSQRGCLVSE